MLGALAVHGILVLAVKVGAGPVARDLRSLGGRLDDGELDGLHAHLLEHLR